MESLAERKKMLRRRMRGVRAGIFSCPEEHARLSLMIQRRAMAEPAWARSGSILLYAAFRDEADTSFLLEQAWLQGKTVALPRCRPAPAEGEMDFFVCRGWADLALSALGILVPGLAFDRRGGRLGYGGGFYDRWLDQGGTAGAGTPLTLGLAFSSQMVDEVPRGTWDRCVRGICTELETIWI